MFLELQLADGQVLKTDVEITGVSVYNERGSELFDIQLLSGVVPVGILRTEVDVARMIRQALNTMNVLQESERT